MMPSYISSPPNYRAKQRADSSSVQSSPVLDGKCGYESSDKDSECEPKTSSSPLKPSPISRLPLTTTYIPIAAAPSRTNSTSSAQKAQPSPALLRVNRGCDGEAVSYQFDNKDVNLEVRTAISPILPEKACAANSKESSRTQSKKLFQPYKIED